MGVRPADAAGRAVTETWRPVVGFEGLYEVSDQGRVRSLDRNVECRRKHGIVRKRVRGALKRPNPDGNGYLHVGLYRGNERLNPTLHTVVAEAFLGPCPPGLEVCHENGKRWDCVLSNLRYDTRVANHEDKRRHGTHICGEDSPRAKLTKKQVIEVRARAEVGKHGALAAEYGVSRGHLSRLARGELWTHV